MSSSRGFKEIALFDAPKELNESGFACGMFHLQKDYKGDIKFSILGADCLTVSLRVFHAELIVSAGFSFNESGSIFNSPRISAVEGKVLAKNGSLFGIANGASFPISKFNLLPVCFAVVFSSLKVSNC